MYSKMFFTMIAGLVILVVLVIVALFLPGMSDEEFYDDEIDVVPYGEDGLGDVDEEVEIEDEGVGLSAGTVRESSLTVRVDEGYDVDELEKFEGFIVNQTTGDRQSVRVYKPSVGIDLPLVVFVPGGSGSGAGFERPGPNGDSDAEALVREGVVVVIYDPLGTGESEGDYDYQGYADQDGIADILFGVKEFDYVDDANIGIASFSYGVTGAAGVLARYPGMGMKFWSDWEGPSSRFYTTVECGEGRAATGRDGGPGSFDCDDEEHWIGREAAVSAFDVHVDYYWRVQQENDHVQDSYGHRLEMVEALVLNDVVDLVRVNDGKVNVVYEEDDEVPVVENGNFYGLYVMSNILEMIDM